MEVTNSGAIAAKDDELAALKKWLDELLASQGEGGQLIAPRDGRLQE